MCVCLVYMCPGVWELVTGGCFSFIGLCVSKDACFVSSQYLATLLAFCVVTCVNLEVGRSCLVGVYVGGAARVFGKCGGAYLVHL